MSQLRVQAAVVCCWTDYFWVPVCYFLALVLSRQAWQTSNCWGALMQCAKVVLLRL
jgi:hypothetical protein